MFDPAYSCSAHAPTPTRGSDRSFPRNFVFQAGVTRIGETEGGNVQDTEAGVPAEFKELAVKRVKSGETVGVDLGLVEQTLRNWVKAAKAGKLLIRSSGRARRHEPFGRATDHIVLSARLLELVAVLTRLCRVSQVRQQPSEFGIRV
jgi:transposase-like protein